MDDRRLSKRLSYVLRHDPASIGVVLDAAGWTSIDALLTGLADAGVRVDRGRLHQLVADSTKQRFELDDPGERIRARYGHSVEVDTAHAPTAPPDVLYHGTHPAALDRILAEGLRPMGRRQVHLSADTADARSIGARRGEPVILEVDAAAMHGEGCRFRQAGRGVWLVDEVPARFLAVR